MLKLTGQESVDNQNGFPAALNEHWRNGLVSLCFFPDTLHHDITAFIQNIGDTHIEITYQHTFKNLIDTQQSNFKSLSYHIYGVKWKGKFSSSAMFYVELDNRTCFVHCSTPDNRRCLKYVWNVEWLKKGRSGALVS